MSSFEWMELQTLTSDIETARTRLLDARKRRDHGRIRALEDEITRAEQRRLQLVAHISTSIASEEPAAAPAPVAADRRGPVAEEPEASPAPVAAAEETKTESVEEAPAEVALEAEAAADESPEPAGTATSPEPAEAEAAPSRKARGSATADETAVAGPDQPEAQAPPDEPQIEVAAAAASPEPAAKALSLEGGSTMWDQLTPTDIDRAKRELGIRRAEILARHAEELKALESEQGQIDTLEQAITSFLQKFTVPGGEAAVVKLDQERELRQQGNS